MNRCSPKRIKINQLNQHLTCALCSGYLIDATTIVECLHSFCRACLLRYFETSNTCPICDTEINESSLDKSIRTDRSLQVLVYKLIPGLYKNEFQRRTEFCMKYYDDSSHASASSSTSNSSKNTATSACKEIFKQIVDPSLIELASKVFAPDDVIVFSLENHTKPVSELDKVEKKPEEPMKLQSCDMQKQMNLKRYFRCPAAVKIMHLKKMLRNKFDKITLLDLEIEIFHGEDVLPQHWTLMDVATVYAWDRKSALKLHFDLCKYEVEEEPMPKLVSEVGRDFPLVEREPSPTNERPPKNVPNPVKFNIDKILTVEKVDGAAKPDAPKLNPCHPVSMAHDKAVECTEKKFTPEKRNDSCHAFGASTKNLVSVDNTVYCNNRGKIDVGSNLMINGNQIKRSSPPLSLIDQQLRDLAEKSAEKSICHNQAKPIKPKAKKSLNFVVQQLFTTTSLKDGSDLQYPSSPTLTNGHHAPKSRAKKTTGGVTIVKVPRLGGGPSTGENSGPEPHGKVYEPAQKKMKRSLQPNGVGVQPKPLEGEDLAEMVVGKSGLNLSDLDLFARPQHADNNGGVDPQKTHVLSCSPQIFCA